MEPNVKIVFGIAAVLSLLGWMALSAAAQTASEEHREDESDAPLPRVDDRASSAKEPVAPPPSAEPPAQLNERPQT